VAECAVVVSGVIDGGTSCILDGNPCGVSVRIDLMNVQLDKETEAFIARKVRDGDFRDASEAIEAAVRLMAEQDQRISELRAALQIGIDQLDRGERVKVGPNFLEDVMARARAKIVAGEKPNPDVLP
jgi:antitoxin ParD1/3/4